ncbi:capsule biosynthesis protein CapA [Rhodobacterales bacterium HKCCE2091]|nr:capsule biosynthesis protein CapA [Rhodobacterales bacterium HKCCE2091]
MDRAFLFLQGPHGPFFARLARQLGAAGAEVLRVGFNAGDRAFWPRHLPYRAFTADLSDWPATCGRIMDETRVTDLVLYGDTRFQHAAAVTEARARGLRIHVFEEGYLRPYWITYERDGSNGHSRLMTLTDAAIAAVLDADAPDLPNPPATWGAMREHIFYGAVYHGLGLVANRRYRAVRPHRDRSVAAEARLYLKLLALMAPHRLERALATRRIRRGGFPYHLVLLQLAHDASFRDHGPFPDMESFLSEVIDGFARGAPAHHHLVFKAHPLEDGRVPLRAAIARLAHARGVAGRVHFVRGGKLARLLDEARTAITVNSTAAHQALWRGIPVKAYGRAIYARPGFTSARPLDGFLAAPDPPDPARYRRFRAYLLATSQVPGSFYSAAGRRKILRRISDMMLAEADPYAAAERGNSAPSTFMTLVK